MLIVMWSACAQSTGIHAAVLAGDTARVRALLDQDPLLVNIADSAGWTPLHLTASRCNQELVELLLARGANVYARVRNGGGTPLHVAASSGCKAIVALLLAHGAGANAIDDNEWTPLHRAALRGDQTVAEVLVAKGANVNAWSNTGVTPIDQAIQMGHNDLAKRLGERGHPTLPIADDFSGNCQWPSGENEHFAFGCDRVGYRMHLKKAGPVHVQQNFALGLPALSAEVDVSVASGPGTEPGRAMLGIGCLSERDHGYIAILRTDGVWAIMRIAKDFTQLAGTNQAGGIRVLGRTNHLRVVCTGGAGKASVVSFFINGQKVGSARDEKSNTVFNGVALYTDTSPGDVVFQRFVAMSASRE